MKPDRGKREEEKKEKLEIKDTRNVGMNWR